MKNKELKTKIMGNLERTFMPRDGISGIEGVCIIGYDDDYVVREIEENYWEYDSKKNELAFYGSIEEAEEKSKVFDKIKSLHDNFHRDFDGMLMRLGYFPLWYWNEKHPDQQKD